MRQMHSQKSREREQKKRGVEEINGSSVRFVCVVCAYTAQVVEVKTFFLFPTTCKITCSCQMLNQEQKSASGPLETKLKLHANNKLLAQHPSQSCYLQASCTSGLQPEEPKV